MKQAHELFGHHMVGTRACVWTPNKDTLLWPVPNKVKWSFRPEVHTEAYVAPPPPTPKPKPPPPKQLSAQELDDLAASQLREAAELENLPKDKKPTLQIQLGLLLISSDEFITKLLKDWDKSGKGQFARMETRVNLRALGLNCTNAEADALFDSWDEDKGGTLDLKEARTALTNVRAEAIKWRNTPNPAIDKAKELRRRAQLATEAAEVSKKADALEIELEESSTKLRSQVDLRLGALLRSRCVKPTAVVTQWSTSKGKHAGELSKVDFRKAVIKLGLASGPYATTIEDIDTVFDMFDEDRGGYLDVEEAKMMVWGLEKAAEDAEHEHFHKQQAATRERANANKKAKEVAKLATKPPDLSQSPTSRPALNNVRAEAIKWRNMPNPAIDKAKELRRPAELATKAAGMTTKADALEIELDEISTKLRSQVDLTAASSPLLW